MELSLMGRSRAVKADLVCRDLGFFLGTQNLKILISSPRKSRIQFGPAIGWPKLSLKVSAARAAVPEIISGETHSSSVRSKPNDGVRLYVGLPLDSVSDCNTINHARAISAGLRALKLLGVDGVELPIWWGVAEKEAMGKYEWSGYLALAEMIQKSGLKLHVSLCFHGSKQAKIPLPQWVSQIGESHPDIFFTDRSGRRYKDCLSLGVDDLPVLDGRTPVQVYQGFCESFKNAFSPFMGSTITGISIGLGPDGELRYPSEHISANSITSLGAGEFQCYDKNMLDHLKQHAAAKGNPLWGLSGPHDAPAYDQQPILNTFFKEGGSWETPYGDYFLSWYSSQLTSHADRLLSMAASTFSDSDVTVSGKLPLLHSWYRARSHPSEIMAGFYNTVKRDGYEEIVKVFSQNSCKVILPRMDLLDEQHPSESLSSPELLLEQITNACRKYNVEVSGQNIKVSGAPKGFEQIKKNLLGENGVADLFIYQRMGAEFFSPEHFPSFTAFVRSLDQLELEAEDLATNEGNTAESMTGTIGTSVHMQAA